MRTLKNVAILMICVPALVLVGCGRDDGQESQPKQEADAQTSDVGGGRAADMPSSAELSEMAEKNRQTLTEMNQGKAIEAVSADTLKDLLPAELPGMQRTGASAERNQMMGVDMATATGEYDATGDGDASISITLTDVGNMSGPMRMGMAAWATTPYSRETDAGYERTTTYSGHKAMEEYDRQSRYGAIRVFVADRFIVEIEGNDITVDVLKQALGKLDFKKLASLASGS